MEGRILKEETTMRTETIINLILGVLAIVASFVGWYFYIRGRAYKAAEGAIDDAEQDGKTGAEKLEIATEQVYAIIPIALKPFITKDIVRGIVQAAFDKIEAYAEKQVKKKKK